MVFPRNLETPKMGHLPPLLLPLFLPPTPLSYFLAVFPLCLPFSFPTDSLFPSFSILFPTITSHPLFKVSSVLTLAPPLFLIPVSILQKDHLAPCSILAPHYPSALGAPCNDLRATSKLTPKPVLFSSVRRAGLYNFTLP